MLIPLANTQLQLLPDSAALILASRSLLLADVHLGKSATFRSRGIPVPEGDTQHDLSRISQLITATDASELIIAGDLLHAASGNTEFVLESLHHWLRSLSIPVILTRGNHDRTADFTSLGIQTTRSLQRAGITICHHPEELQPDQPGIAGHLHPALRLRSGKAPAITLRGFYFKQQKHLILPAFSLFTGTHTINLEENDTFFSCTEGKLHKITPKP